MTGRLADAILVARDLLARNGEMLTERLPAHPQLSSDCGRPSAGVPVFEQLMASNSRTIEDAVREQAAAGSPTGTYRIDRIDVPVAEASISSGEDGGLKSADRIIRSMLLKYTSHARILLVDNLNPCWTRFAMCKEFAHLIMDEQHGLKALSVERQIADAMDIARSPQPDKDLSSEAFAWFTAVELLLPISDRVNFMARHGAGEDHLSLARSYWVPKAVIDLFFNTPYLTVSNSIR